MSPPKHPLDPRELREHALTRLPERRTRVAALSDAEVESLVYELEVHQVELEVQNEELRRAQAEVTEARDRYLDLYEFAPMGYLTLDRRAIVRQANLTAAALCGRDRAQLIGERLEKLVVHEDRDTCYRLLQGVTDAEQGTGELRLERTDGRTVWVNAEVSLSARAGAAHSGYRLTLSEVTQRRAAETALRIERARLSELNPDAILVTREHTIVYANQAAAALLGAPSPAALVGRAAQDFVDPGYHARERERLSRVLHEQRTTPLAEQYWRRIDGGRVDVEVTSSFLMWQEQPSVQTVARDIRARKQSAQALRAANTKLIDADHRKDEFIATLAHELRNPLAPLRNVLATLQRTNPTPALAKEMYAMMDRQVAHLVRLVSDLLDVSRITRGIVELRTQATPLEDIIRSAVETAGLSSDSSQRELTVQASEPLTVEADPVRLVQVVSNLLNNAVTFTPQGGHIWITTHREAEQAIISVRDDGKGIAADMLAQVFDMFTQADRDTGGLGIGLTLVQSLVKLHSGSTEVHSAGLGHGSEFIIRLPLVAPAAATAADESPNAAIAAGGQALVVDDNHDAADSLAMLLRSLNVDTHVVYDGPAALAALAAREFRIVFLDIGMPQMDGYAVARAIHDRYAHRTMTLVALTGWSHAEARREVQAAGFHHHLVKPISLDGLHAVLAPPSRNA